MPIFKVQKNKDFTVMSNNHLRNKELSLKAKGLLSMMLSLPENWDYTLKGLASICKEGIDSVRAAVNELQACGYIERRRIRDAKGRIAEVEYLIHEFPVDVKKNTLADKSSDNVDNSGTSEPISEKPTSDFPMLSNPRLENPILDNPTLDKATQLNTKELKTKELNTDLINNPSINQDNAGSLRAAGAKEKINNGNEIRWIDRYNKNKQLVKMNIDYDSLEVTEDKKLLDDIVEVMTEVLTLDTPYYKINGHQYSSELVKERFRHIDANMVSIYLLMYSKNRSVISNPKGYMISSLFNLQSTANTALDNLVNSEL